MYCKFDDTKNISACKIGKEYSIERFSILVTKYGLKIVCKLAEFSVFLPGRFAEHYKLINDDTIRLMNSTDDYFLKYRGDEPYRNTNQRLCWYIGPQRSPI